MAMRSLVFLLIVSFTCLKAQSVITGVVTSDGDPFPGCGVSLMHTNTTQYTDVDGRFVMFAGDQKKLTVVIDFEGSTCKMVIDEIPVVGARIDLGTIPLFYNKMIDVPVYEKLSPDKKKEYKAIYHWVKLLGYISTSRSDTTQIWNELRLKKGIPYRFDSLDNNVVIHYSDWKR